MRSLNFWAAQRAYPARTFPREGYFQAFEYSRDHLSEVTGPAPAEDVGFPAGKGGNTRRTIPDLSWQALGPHNIGGRTLAVALNPQNPNTVWAGSASGGLWRSFTGGQGALAWHYVHTCFPVLGVSSIAIDPDDSNTIYIGTGEVYSYDDTQGGIAVRLTRGSYGIGILKTTDGGATWAKSLDWTYQQQRGVWTIRIDPTNHDRVWAGTTEGTYKTLDGGDTWFQVDATIMVNDLAINPADPGTVFIACGNLSSPGHGIYRTTDHGANWTKMVQPGILPPNFAGKAQLSICESSPNTVLVSLGNGGQGSYATWLCRSNNGGDSWSLVSTEDYSLWQGWFSHDVAVHPEDPSTVIAVGIDIWKSTQGGANLVRKSDWASWYFGLVQPGEPEGPPWYSHADHHDLVYHPTNRDIIYFANDGGIFRSLDGGETFAGCNGGYQTQQFYAGFSSSRLDSNHAMGGMQDNCTAIFTGTVAWARVIGGDGSWTAIDPNNGLTLYGSYQYLNILKSSNGGDDWLDVTPPEGGETGFIAPFALGGPAEPQVLYAGRGYVFKSATGGLSWYGINYDSYLGGNPALAMEVSQTNSDVVYVTTAPVNAPAGVFRTLDGGTTWQDVTGSLPDRYPVGLAIDPNDDHTVYVAFSGFGSSHVFKSGNAGDTWGDIGAGLPDVPTSSVVVDPANSDHVYVGNDIGVYISLTGGGSWYEFRSGLPDAVVAMDLTVSPQSRKLRVSTYGNGVYERPFYHDVVAVPDGPPVAALVRLDQNHPNPFNPLTTISYSLAADCEVELTVFDAAGRRIRTLFSGPQGRGEHSLQWDGRDRRGAAVASGAYLYRLRAGNRVQTKRMLLIR